MVIDVVWEIQFLQTKIPSHFVRNKKPHCCRGSLLGSLMHIKAATYDDVMEDKSRICGKHTAALWLDVPGWGCESRQKLPEAAVLSTVQLPFRCDHLDFDPAPCLVWTKNPTSFHRLPLAFPQYPLLYSDGIAIRCFEGNPNPWHVRDYFTVKYVLLPFGSNLIFWQILQSGLRNFIY